MASPGRSQSARDMRVPTGHATNSNRTLIHFAIPNIHSPSLVLKGFGMNAQIQLLLCCILLTLALACTRHPHPVPGEERILVLPGGAEMSMIYCPPGTFLMGSPEDEEGRSADESLHEVTLTSGFWLGKTEVTQAQWCSVMGCDPFEKPTISEGYICPPDWQVLPLVACNPSWTRGAEYPVQNLMWEDCQRFVRKINKQMPGVRVMLPTEAQWEYACRAGNLGAFSGNDVDELAWHVEGHPAASTEGSFAEIDSWQPEKTWMKWGDPVPDDGWWHPHPVAGKKPNPWGFYDMHGNVAEWCRDGYGPYRGDCKNPVGKVTQWDELGCEFYVLRGAFPDDPGRCEASACRSAARYGRPVNHGEGPCGFRLAASERSL